MRSDVRRGSVCRKIDQIADTFEKMRNQPKKVCQIVNTFEKMISKLKKTNEFLKVACQKCETLVADSRKLQDAFRKTMTFR